MDNYNELKTLIECSPCKVNMSIHQGGEQIWFETEGLPVWYTAEVFQSILVHSQKLQQARSQRNRRLMIFILLFQVFLLGLTAHGQLQRTGGDNTKQGQVQHQSRWANRV